MLYVHQGRNRIGSTLYLTFRTVNGVQMKRYLRRPQELKTTIFQQDF